MSKHGVIVLAGSLAQKPEHGGHTWVFLHYLLGFRRLGWDVLFLDEMQPAMCTDAGGAACSPKDSRQIRFLGELMERFGLGQSYAVRVGERWFGLSREETLRRVRRSALFINVMGFLRDEAILAAAPRRVFLDIDPGFGQIWKALGLADSFAGHDDFVTIGENIGKSGCPIPTCGLTWITTPQPVVLDQWPVRDQGEAFTSIASWRGAYGPVEYEGKTYGLRVHEFRKFAALPRRCPERFQLALDIHDAETKDRELLHENGWTLIDPRQAAGDAWRYRDFIQRSRAEFMVAKNMYVESRCGWISDRSLCYLASGKPVLAQETGLRDLYPTTQGLVTFTTLEEAIAGCATIARDYQRHARAARSTAAEFFDSDKVLGRLLAKLGIG